MKKILFLLPIFFLLINCKDSDAASDNDLKLSKIKMAPAAAAYDDEAVVDSSAVVAVEASAPQDNSESETIEPQIIRNANLKFETSDLEKTYNSVLASVKKAKGTIQNDSEYKGDYALSRSLVIRIPSASFDSFISETSSDVSYFDNKEISSNDVTEEYVDVQSRIKTKKVLEVRYLELLKKANKVSEMLEIEQQLSTIREEIEAKEGRLKYIKNKVAQSTINLEFYKTIALESGATSGFWSKIWNAIVSGFNGISNFFIGLISIWPFLLLLGGIIYFIRKKLLRRKKKVE